MAWVDRDGFAALFDDFEHSLWRLEQRGHYEEPDEAEPFRQFLDGEPQDLGWMAEFFDWTRAATGQGKRFQRVRVLTDPLTDYLRFQLSFTADAVAAGDDIRVLEPRVAAVLKLPAEDFWLFDDARVAAISFGDTGVTGAEVITDPVEVDRYRAVRQRAWTAATPFDEWVRSNH